MRTHPRSGWLALPAAALLVTLSVSSAFGARPADANPNHGRQVSQFVHDLHASDQNSDEDSAADDEEAADEAGAGQPDNHGSCVAQVAHSGDTGGPKNNHGGAVSHAARVTCWEDPGDGDGGGGGGDEG